MPFPLQRIETDSEKAERTVTTPVIFGRRRFIISVNNHLAILVTYGAFCPPLAFIVCFGVISFTLTEQLILARFIVNCRAAGVTRYDALVAQQLHQLSQLLPGSFWIIVTFSTLFYAYFVFDPLGSTEGWKSAFWAPAAMLCVPLLLKFQQSLADRDYFGAAISLLGQKQQKRESELDEPTAARTISIYPEITMDKNGHNVNNPLFR